MFYDIKDSLDLFQSLKRSTSNIDHDTSSTCHCLITDGWHNHKNITTYDVKEQRKEYIVFQCLQSSGMLDV